MRVAVQLASPFGEIQRWSFGGGREPTLPRLTAPFIVAAPVGGSHS